MGLIEIKIFFMLIGTILGFIITWTFVSHRFWNYKFYKDEYERYYRKWYSVRKRANNAYWYLYQLWKQNDNMDDLSKKAYFELTYWYEDEKDE